MTQGLEPRVSRGRNFTLSGEEAVSGAMSFRREIYYSSKRFTLKTLTDVGA